MNNYNHKTVLAIASFMLCLALFSCGKMDEHYSDFLAGGEFIYPGKADSLTLHAGNYRAELWWLQADPRVKRAKIYWNNRADSLEVPIKKINAVDTLKIPLTGLEEKIYTFEVFTYDEDGNESVKSEEQGQIYGDLYRDALLNRAIRSVFIKGGVLGIDWLPAEETAIGGEVSYRLGDGGLKTLAVPSSEDSTWLPDFAPGNNFTYRTLFVPDSNAIDTFYAKVEEKEVDESLFEKQEVELDKGNFSAYHLPTDTDEPNAAGAGMENIWDGELNKENNTFITKTTGSLPQWFTFDLGVVANLTKMKVNQRGLAKTRVYNGGNVKKWEVWGSVNPALDGSWDDSWVLLAECTSTKPSGEAAVTDEDLAYALAGEEFQLDENAPSVRYIRFKTLGNWDSQGRGFVNIGQLTFWGKIN